VHQCTLPLSVMPFLQSAGISHTGKGSAPTSIRVGIGRTDLRGRGGEEALDLLHEEGDLIAVLPLNAPNGPLVQLDPQVGVVEHDLQRRARRLLTLAPHALAPR
jgi:hypothetical protein